MSKRTVCYDTNLLIDMLLQRQRVSILESRNKEDIIYATAYSIGTVYYVANQKQKVDNRSFKKFIDQIKIVTIDDEVIRSSLEIAQENDLEDAIQIAACKQAGIEIFATADKKICELYSHLLEIELIA